MEKNYDVIILFSGGVESITLSQLAKTLNLKPYFLLIDYNQKHIEELDYAKKYLADCYPEYAKRYDGQEGIPQGYDNYPGPKIKNWDLVKIDLNINSALTGSGEKGLYTDVSKYHVPMRNTIFLSIACSYAESMGVPKVWLGASYDDAVHNFVDCEQKYILEFNELLKFASSANITVEAPFLGFRKEMVIKLLKSYGVSLEVAFSGYGQFT